MVPLFPKIRSSSVRGWYRLLDYLFLLCPPSQVSKTEELLWRLVRQQGRTEIDLFHPAYYGCFFNYEAYHADVQLWLLQHRYRKQSRYCSPELDLQWGFTHWERLNELTKDYTLDRSWTLYCRMLRERAESHPLSEYKNVGLYDLQTILDKFIALHAALKPRYHDQFWISDMRVYEASRKHFPHLWCIRQALPDFFSPEALDSIDRYAQAKWTKHELLAQLPAVKDPDLTDYVGLAV